MTVLPRNKSFGYQVNHLARLFARAIAMRNAAVGVMPGQMPTLLALLEEDGLTQKVLRERIQVEQPTLANTLNRMERDSLIERHPDPVDKRQSFIFLTDKARNVARTVITNAMAVNDTATTGLSPDQKALALSLIDHMIGNLTDMVDSQEQEGE